MKFINLYKIRLKLMGSIIKMVYLPVDMAKYIKLIICKWKCSQESKTPGMTPVIDEANHEICMGND